MLWAVANVVLAVVLIPPAGLKGMAIATTLPILVLEPLYIKVALREFAMPLQEFMRGAVLPAFLPAVIAAPVLMVPDLTGNSMQVLPVIVATATFGLVYAACFLYWGLEPDERARVPTRLARRVGSG